MLYSKRHIVASEGRPGGDPWVKENVNPAVLFRPTITCAKSPSVFKGQPGHFRRVSPYIPSSNPDEWVYWGSLLLITRTTLYPSVDYNSLGNRGKYKDEPNWLSLMFADMNFQFRYWTNSQVISASKLIILVQPTVWKGSWIWGGKRTPSSNTKVPRDLSTLLQRMSCEFLSVAIGSAIKAHLVLESGQPCETYITGRYLWPESRAQSISFSNYFLNQNGHVLLQLESYWCSSGVRPLVSTQLTSDHLIHRLELLKWTVLSTWAQVWFQCDLRVWPCVGDSYFCLWQRPLTFSNVASDERPFSTLHG